VKDNYLRIGVISSTHGVHGEVKVRPTTDDIRRFDDTEEVILSYPDGRREKHSVSSVKYFKNQVILGFSDVTDMDRAYTLRNAEILIDREHAIPLDKGEYFIGDIIGLSVYDEYDRFLGKCTDVISTGANDVYQVTGQDGKSLLIPAIKSCILMVLPAEGRMKVHLLPGLEDL